MNIYCIIYPSDFSDTESHNQLWDNIGEMRWKQIADGVIFVFSTLRKIDLAKVLFKGVSPEYCAAVFLVGQATVSPKDVLST
jgi:hypothetical protein